MNSIWLCLALSLPLPEGDAAARLKAICDGLASAPSVTLEVGLPPLVDQRTTRKKDGSTVAVGGSKGGAPQKLVWRVEAGKPEFMTLDDAEIFRFENGELVGRLAGGDWSVLPPGGEPDPVKRPFTTTDGKTALDRLVHAARRLPSPESWFRKIEGEIGEATESKEGDVTVLKAWVNGYSENRTRPVSTADDVKTIENETTSVIARLRADGGVASVTVASCFQRRTEDGGVSLGVSVQRLTPSAQGETRVDVPPEVTALAGQ